jgi:hypothetical protein
MRCADAGADLARITVQVLVALLCFFLTTYTSIGNALYTTEARCSLLAQL